MAKASKETIRKRVAGQRGARAKRRRMARERVHSSMGPELAARVRLDADGASKSGQINRRVLWLVREWQLPRCPKIGHTMTPELVGYCKTHGVSMDWLLCGDLKGLHRMMMKRRDRYVPPDSYERLMQKVDALSPEDRQWFHEQAQRIIDKHRQTSPEHEPA
jgi:hypothetical protein